ncbi:plasmid stabilization system family protein [Rickettsia felis str. Pedreira]|uniref:Plasmid stabilization system family protein n=2 Tax=Rickettsia felis TaxID=42862 RepID=A0A0F3MSH8_RICFI|nr:type II toxin-antitoxin system RelE/ParE family toxin [Rickettsia felis]AAY62137.1 Cytotoxic translational repressor of toxin-antitoxin system RelE [Rickettsia felis URRWXCal2]KHO02640.1 cytotoxin [Rickettsia felis]KJV58690.1 plasmid stabilization system family protein [Rickettsia felis str. Pedreira]MDE8610715.1 type II toxin-antitoxin system RelE/ParE family toxin [Rickettsia felis]
MQYKLSFSKTALKNLLKISTNKRKAILEKLEQLKLNPYKENNNIKKLIGYDGYRLRIGDYRVIYRINKGKLEILVINVDVRG